MHIVRLIVENKVLRYLFDLDLTNKRIDGEKFYNSKAIKTLGKTSAQINYWQIDSRYYTNYVIA